MEDPTRLPETTEIEALGARLAALEQGVAGATATIQQILQQLTDRLLRLEQRPSATTPPPDPPRAAMRARGPASAPPDDGSWRRRLYTPTYLAALDGFHFLVDCWHHRILWSRDCVPDLAAWQTLDESLAGPHSVASDGRNVVAEDTGLHRLRVYQHREGEFRLVNLVDRLGQRPHRVRYLPDRERFAVIAQDLYLVALDGDGAVAGIDRIRLDFLQGSYTRSFTVHDGSIYFVSGNGFIHQTVLRDQGIEVVRRFRVPEEARSMNDLWFADGEVWLTSSPRSILSAATLAALDRGEYRDRYASMGFRGTPYYFSEIEGAWVVPEIIEYSSIRRFAPPSKSAPRPLGPWFDSGPPAPASQARYEAFPK